MQQFNIQPIEHKVVSDGLSLDVHSIFYTVQGEGPFNGKPAVFIRLAGCNLQCPACDTNYTTNRKNLTTHQILQKVNDSYMLNGYFGISLPIVVITGGEPFRQNITPLVASLHNAGYTVQVETNGTLHPPQGLHPKTVIVCSPKTTKINSVTAYLATCFKYVLSARSMDETDGLPLLALDHPARPKVARPPEGRWVDIYLQPLDEQDAERNATNVEAVKQSCLKHGYRVNLQLHKILGME